MKTVLVTGANGLLGQKVVNLLAGRKHVQLAATGYGPNRNPYRTGYQYLAADLTRFDEVKRLVETVKPTDIIHAAAMTNVDACELQPEACRAANVDAVRYLCGLCAETGARLVHLSTDFIFDGEAGPYREGDAPNPLSVYGAAKLEAERIVQQSGIPAAIARTVLLYGTVPGMSRSNIVLWVKTSLEKQQPIRVVNDQVRSPTLAEDLADGVAALLFGEREGVYHLSGGEIMSVLEIAERTADYWGLDRQLIEPISSAALNQPAKRPPRTGFIILKAQTELDYQPHNFEAGLELLAGQL